MGSAAGRAAELADPAARVRTKDKVLTAGDYLSAYVLECTLHHLDPDRPPALRSPPARRDPGGGAPCSSADRGRPVPRCSLRGV
ncbi:hypothetical protein GCM10009535_32890 [Streptomyces thermocarboxydovorans]|uniref:Uncharacterized protein n=1 Tax=Streptomyces thermocarboxydovorans TaxID=59298 RepID=A0ABN1HIV7_9ACTN